MNNDNELTWKYLEDWFQRMFHLMYDKEISNDGSIKLFPVIVQSKNVDGTVNVVMPHDLVNVISNIKNQAANPINVNDTVYCIAINRSMSNFFIAWSFSK